MRKVRMYRDGILTVSTFSVGLENSRCSCPSHSVAQKISPRKPGTIYSVGC